MARPYFSTLRTRLIVLVLLAVAPVFGLMLYSGAEQQRKALAEAETNSTNLAMELRAIQKTQIEKMRQTLITLSQLPQVQQLVWLNNHLAARNLPQGATCNVVDRKGIVLARYPVPEGLVGTSISASPIFRTILSKGQGATDGSALRGMPCVLGFAPFAFGSESIYVYVTTPREVAFAKAHHELLLNFGLSVIVFVLTLFATWLVGERFILRQVNSLLELTKEVAGGNLASRSNVSYTVGELGQLACSFDRMIESLQYREGLRQQAQDQMLQVFSIL